MRDSPKLKWSKIFEQWKQHSVDPPEIRKFDPSKHLPGVPWIDKAAEANLYSYYAVSNPQVDTAGVLIEGTVTKTSEVFSAFAIHAFLVYKEPPYKLGLIQAVREAITKLDPRPGLYWTSNAKNIFLHPDGFQIDFYFRERATWKDWVDAAAKFWKMTRDKYALIHIPDFMDPGSDEYKEWSELTRKRYEEREKEEYERLRAKFERPN